ncbi:hypothetical protein PTI45_02723 [Paenibacillus nuruki]|uniref:Uncharacterized protein n=1 Tax=Paenibacillus nuruki TaxID=1886670 RepID=A0A1E3L2I4_9BACL|nr:hypothetical protein [Paenibacillus nuruki]ODP27904.1 hypothetical protein PTI45_02723 [Paenibacillus nuruki]
MDSPDKHVITSREERERIGRQTNAGFARVENADAKEDESHILLQPAAPELTEEEIKKRVGAGNFESAKDDGQHNSVNS